MSEKERFNLTENHIKLIRRMSVGYNEDCEYGAPEIDPKRPYGNSSVEQDILEIIGIKELRKGVYEVELNGKHYLLKGENKYNIEFEGEEDEKLVKQVQKLHRETETALQIVLSRGSFDTGLFEEVSYGKWEPVKK
jgi:hypothetical protein